MVAQGGKAAAFLLAAGFCGGFCLTKGSAHLMAPAVASMAGQGGGAGEPAGAFPGQDDSGDASKHGRGSEGSEHPASGRTSEGSGKDAAQAGDGKDALPAPPAVAPSVPDILTGNTLTAVKGGATITRYLDRAGWQAVETRPGLLTVKHWVQRVGQLCEVTATVACEPITVAPDKTAGSPTGDVLGTATLAGLRWTVRRGKPADIPDVVPLIDGEQPAARPLGAKVTLAGEKALQRFLGRTLLAQDGGKGDRYETDGRWIAARPLQPGATPGRDGVQVAIGRWLFTTGKLCLDEPGLELSRLCYRAEQWGPDTLRLVADRTGAVTTLMATATR